MSNAQYGFLVEGLRQRNLLPRTDTADFYETAIEYHGAFVRSSEWFQQLPSIYRKQYAEAAARHSMRHILASQSFGRVPDDEAISAAVAFCMVGCILDDMIDNGTIAERRQAQEFLDWTYCSAYFENFDSRAGAHAVDFLYETVGSFLDMHKNQDEEAYELLIEHLKRASEAERHTLTYEQTFDKSELFTVLGFEIALFGQHTAEEWAAFQLCGRISRLIDDLCDADQDIIARRPNSLVKRHGALTSRMIEVVLNEIEEALQLLSRTASEAFSDFMRYTVQQWTMDNPEVAQVTAEICAE